MKITDEHLYHGAALTQIAEHTSFTAINGLRTDDKLHRSAFVINEKISVYFKYATNPTKPHQEYQFTFNQNHLNDLALITKSKKHLFVALVCVKAQEICCVAYDLLLQMLAERRSRITGENTFTILVTAPKGKKMRVYMNAPGKKAAALTQHLIARNAFPDDLFNASPLKKIAKGSK